MQWLHNIFDQAKYCILDMAVLVLFCIGIVRIVRAEAERLRDAKKSQGRGVQAAPQSKSAANPPRNGGAKKTNGMKAGAPQRPPEPARKP